MISEREKYLMREAMKASSFYKNLDSWLNEVISDAGNTVEEHLDHDATRLHGGNDARPRTNN